MATFGDFTRLGMGNFGGGKLTTGKLPAYGAQPDPNAAPAAPAAAAQPKQWGGWGGQATPKQAPQAIQPNGQITAPAAPAAPAAPKFWPNGQPMVNETADAYKSMGYQAPEMSTPDPMPAPGNTGIVPPGTGAWKPNGAGLSGVLPPNLLASIGTGMGDFAKNGGWADNPADRARQIIAPMNQGVHDAFTNNVGARQGERRAVQGNYMAPGQLRPESGRGSLNQGGPRYADSMTSAQIQADQQSKYHQAQQGAVAALNADPQAAFNDPNVMAHLNPNVFQYLNPTSAAALRSHYKQEYEGEVGRWQAMLTSGDYQDPGNIAAIQGQIAELQKQYQPWIG